MKRSRLSRIGAGFAMALAALTGTAQATQSLTAATTQSEIKAPDIKTNAPERKVERKTGGFPLPSFFPTYGLSPREYGLRFGSGGKKKSNRLRFSHNAKLKRR